MAKKTEKGEKTKPIIRLKENNKDKGKIIKRKRR